MKNPNFGGMSETELSDWYIENVGYDLAVEDPQMTLTEYREICAQVFELQNRVIP